MREFNGKLAVVTGGASGIGRELVIQLAGRGASVAMCDLSEDGMSETRDLALANSPEATITAHVCDVSDEESVITFRDEVTAQHDTDHIHLLFNNAGLSGGGSMIADTRESWDRCFGVCWGGVYHGTRAFLPLLVAADEAHLINVSSVNGFWATLGPERPHTAYSAAKFAVKGFTEGLVTDMRQNAPHVKVTLVMPGHIGTSIIQNSLLYGAAETGEREAAEMTALSEWFKNEAPVSAAEAATVILEAVRDERWRLLIGDDAQALDVAVRAEPELAYEKGLFSEALTRAGESLAGD